METENEGEGSAFREDASGRREGADGTDTAAEPALTVPAATAEEAARLTCFKVLRFSAETVFWLCRQIFTGFFPCATTGAGANVPQKNTSTASQSRIFFIVYILLFSQIRPQKYLGPSAAWDFCPFGGLTPPKRYNFYMKQQQKTWQGSSTKRRNSAFFLFVFLGMLTAFAPFVTDMYLPSLPAMTHYFGVSASMVQLGLTFSMLGLAIGQIIFGPLSDKFGRRLPLLASMVLYLLATAGCIFAPNIHLFIALRLMQGMAAAGGIVISRSIATDKFKGRNLATALAIVGAINGIAPVAAPVIGGSVLKVTSWRGVFGVLFVLGALVLAACIHFNESLSTKRRIHHTV